MTDRETIKDTIERLRLMLPPKVDYAELVGAEGFAYGHHSVYEDPEPYFIEGAISLIERLQSENTRQQAEIERYKGVIKTLEKDVENKRIAAQEFYNRLKVAEFEPIPIEIKDYAEGYNKATRDVRMYMTREYGVKPLSRKQAEQALKGGEE